MFYMERVYAMSVSDSCVPARANNRLKEIHT